MVDWVGCSEVGGLGYTVHKKIISVACRAENSVQTQGGKRLRLNYYYYLAGQRYERFINNWQGEYETLERGNDKCKGTWKVWNQAVTRNE